MTPFAPTVKPGYEEDSKLFAFGDNRCYSWGFIGVLLYSLDSWCARYGQLGVGDIIPRSVGVELRVR